MLLHQDFPKKHTHTFKIPVLYLDYIHTEEYNNMNICDPFYSENDQNVSCLETVSVAT